MSQKYDVIIVGGGPAGIFAALELSQSAKLSVLLIEKGNDIDKRRCPIQSKAMRCAACSPCNMVCGLGGAGAFSDGKLTLSAEVGGRLHELIGRPETERFVDYVDSAYLKFGAPQQVFGVGDKVDRFRRLATLAELRLVPVRLRHMGTERSRLVLREMRDSIAPRVDIRLGEMAQAIITRDGRVIGVHTASGQDLRCDYLILAPGREGADWLEREARRLKLTLTSNPVDVGIRVELPAPVLDDITSVLYESKLEFYSPSFDDRIRTFCMCPHGEVLVESTGGADPVVTVNGASYADKKTNNTNFAILVSTTFTEPFRDPIGYGRYLARLANILSGGVLVQRLGDLLEGHRSTPSRIRNSIVEPTLKAATPGDLSFALPFRHLKGIVEMLQAMDKMVPGVASRSTLLYGLEVKFYSSQVKLKPTMETEVSNMFAAGDGAGVSRGMVQASISGVIAAREVMRRSGAPRRRPALTRRARQAARQQDQME